MKIKAHLSIGYSNARQDEIIEIPDEDLRGMTQEQRSDYVNDCVQEWADNYIETWWDEEL